MDDGDLRTPDALARGACQKPERYLFLSSFSCMNEGATMIGEFPLFKEFYKGKELRTIDSR